MSCGDDDPLTQSNWVGFCDDRVDDNCTIDAPLDPCPFTVSAHQYCQTGDEPCPATQPTSGPPAFDCTGAIPRNVIAHAQLETPNDQVQSLCVFFYESDAVPGEVYAAYVHEDGVDPAGPDFTCATDLIYRRYLFVADNDPAPCDPVTVPFPSSADDYKISNACRKALRPVAQDDPLFSPDIQYFAASVDEALQKLAVLDTAEIGCLRAVNPDGAEIRPWALQASAPIVIDAAPPD